MTTESYMKSTYRYGNASCILALIFFLMLPVAICAHLSVSPDWSNVLKGLGSIAIIFYPTAVIEVVAYAPLLGAGGTYLCFVSGNITNLKMPCALNAMENSDVDSNSEEGELIKTIAIGTSAITTTIVIALFVLAFTLNPSFSEIFSDTSPLAPAFDQLTYTIFGAIAATYFVKHWKISIFPIAAVSLLLVFAGTIEIGVLIFVGVVFSLLGAQIMYKLKLI